MNITNTKAFKLCVQIYLSNTILNLCDKSHLNKVNRYSTLSLLQYLTNKFGENNINNRIAEACASTVECYKCPLAFVTTHKICQVSYFHLLLK